MRVEDLKGKEILKKLKILMILRIVMVTLIPRIINHLSDKAWEI